MTTLDFNKETPYFENGNFKWYIDKELNQYIQTEQAFNLPALKNLAAFVVKEGDKTLYVLTLNNESVISEYHYNGEGYGQMVAHVNIRKVSKYYGDEESKVNV